MEAREIKKITMEYFGINPTTKVPKNMEFKITRGEDYEGDIEEIKKIKIPWEEHIGNLSGVARISPLDLMYYLKMSNSRENYEKAVNMLKGFAKIYGGYFVEVVGKNKYLLINPKFKR